MIAPIDDAVWPELCRYDAAAFGSDRRALLARLRAGPAERTCGAARWPHRGLPAGTRWADVRAAWAVGHEDDAAVARRSSRAMAAIDGPIYVDLADSHIAVGTWLEALGFTAQRPLTRMVYRRPAGFDDPARTYAVVGPEFG